MKKDYLVITNKLKKTLVYYPVAKNANSSSKLFLIKHLGIQNNFYFSEDDIPRHKITPESLKNYNNKISIINFLPNYTEFNKINVDEKACIVRDPIERFISAYKNRILYHKDNEFKNHSVDEVLEKLENNLFENKHFLQQSFWLGNDINYFTIIANIKKLSPFIVSINKFFSKNIEFPKIQSGGREFLINLNASQKDKIFKIYANDYDLVGNYL